jgi:site-specific recombinase XerD
MMTKTEPFKAHYLPVEAWPVPCQIAWHGAFAETTLFDDQKPARGWREATIHKTRTGFGAFISWRIFEGTLEQEADVIELVTRDAASRYLEALKSSPYAPLTILCRIQELYDAARVMAPSHDWAWLRHATKRLRVKAHPVRNKRIRLQPAQALEQLAYQLMYEAQTSKELSFYQRALRFRDGLMIGLLIRRPLRLKNFASLTLAQNLILHHKSATLTFLPNEMKGKRPFDVKFPKAYFEALQTYLTLYRPYLLTLGHADDHVTQALNQSGQQHALWISNEGKQMADQSIRNAIKRRTLIAFGLDMTPHLFRDASVTTLVRDAPSSARLTRVILGHATIDVTNKHYNQSRMIETSRRHTSLIEQLTTNALKETP